MAKNKNEVIDGVYSHIVINKTKRAGISLLVVLVGIAVGSFIYANLIFQVHWGVWAFPVAMLCCATLIAPISEEWNYQPWQKFPQQVEHHYNEY